MRDTETISELTSLQGIFNSRKGEGGKRLDYAKQAEALGAVVFDLRNKNYIDAQKKLEEVQRSFNSAAYRLEHDIKDARMFSDEKTKLARDMEQVKNYASQLSTLVRYIAYDAKKQIEEQAAQDTGTLVAAAERVQRGNTYENRHGITNDIVDFLVLSAKNQQRQDQLIKDMAEKIAKLEAKLAQYEDPRELDKPKIRPTGPTP